MKFTKEEAYKELVAQLTANGEKLNLSERSINEQLEALMPLVANDETELSDFTQKTLSLFKTANANVRNDVSAGINEYKKNNPIVEKPKPTAIEEKKEGNEALIARLDALEKELSDAKREKNISDIRSRLVEKMKEKGIKDDEWIENFVSEISITEDFDVDAKAERYVDVYNKMNARIDPNVSPSKAHGGNGNEDHLKETIKQAAAFAKAQRLID